MEPPPQKNKKKLNVNMDLVRVEVAMTKRIFIIINCILVSMQTQANSRSESGGALKNGQIKYLSDVTHARKSCVPEEHKVKMNLTD